MAWASAASASALSWRVESTKSSAPPVWPLETVVNAPCRTRACQRHAPAGATPASATAARWSGRVTKPGRPWRARSAGSRSTRSPSSPRRGSRRSAGSQRPGAPVSALKSSATSHAWRAQASSATAMWPPRASVASVACRARAARSVNPGGASRCSQPHGACTPCSVQVPWARPVAASMAMSSTPPATRSACSAASSTEREVCPGSVVQTFGSSGVIQRFSQSARAWVAAAGRAARHAAAPQASTAAATPSQIARRIRSSTRSPRPRCARARAGP